MRRCLVLVFTTAVLLAAVASPAAAAAETYRYSVRGSGAWASAFLQEGGRFEAGWVEIGDQLTTASDGETYLSYVLFEYLLELCDDNGCTTEYISGLAENVPFSIDRKKLTSASLDVSVDSFRCVSDGVTETCDEVSVPIDVTWAGYGTFIRSHGTSSGGISGVYQYTLNGAATERWANVSGSIGDFDLETGSPVGAIYTTRYGERMIQHG